MTYGTTIAETLDDPRRYLDAFTRGYITAALWSSVDIDTDEPLDANHDIEDISRDALKTMIGDCLRFQAENASKLTGCTYTGCPLLEYAGHDFWLTRNGHGAGFWDGDFKEPFATAATEWSRAQGECWVIFDAETETLSLEGY